MARNRYENKYNSTELRKLVLEENELAIFDKAHTHNRDILLKKYEE